MPEYKVVRQEPFYFQEGPTKMCVCGKLITLRWIAGQQDDGFGETCKNCGRVHEVLRGGYTYFLKEPIS